MRASILISLAITLLASLLIRWPLISAGSPFLYLEDDAHHFNRTVEMAKNRDLHPHYFNKPSLHFYLRIPVVYAAAWQAERAGELSRLKEVRTRDPYGLAGYAFTVSHPTILKWSRAFSIVTSIVLVVLTFWLAIALKVPPLLASAAALLTALSPEVLKNSPLIGVDILMALFCVASAIYGVLTVESFSMRRLVLSACFAGLACSSKYNAAPIVAVPFFACLLARKLSLKTFAASALIPVAAFFMASPYILISFNEFLNGVSYEIWHYSLAGHEAHSAEPGLAQAIFYTKWFFSDGVGIIAGLFALAGILYVALDRTPGTIIFATFPVFYGILMVLQRANFTRNMVTMVPFGAICAAVGIQWIASRLPQRPRSMITLSLSALMLIHPSMMALEFVSSSFHHPESRRSLTAWIENRAGEPGDIAIAGPLQLPIAIFAQPGVDAFDPQKRSAADLFQAGFDFIAYPIWLADPGIERFSKEVISFPGNNAPLRIPDNPEIKVFQFNEASLSALAEAAPRALSLAQPSTDAALGCERPGEEYCWISARSTTVTNTSGSDMPELELMNPWADQTVKISTDGSTSTTISLAAPGAWVPLSLPAVKSFMLTISSVHSPASLGISSDNRRLGVAIRASRSQNR